MNKLFRLYRDLFFRRPTTFIISFVISIGVYGYVLAKFGIINVRLFSQPTMAIQLEPTEIYALRFEKLASKRVRVALNSKEPIEKVTTTIQAPKFVDQIKLVSSPQIKADISKFESPNGRKRYEVVYRSVESKQELVIVLAGLTSSGTTPTDTFSDDTAVIVEVVGSTNSGRLFGASAIGQFSLKDSDQAQSSKDASSE